MHRADVSHEESDIGLGTGHAGNNEETGERSPIQLHTFKIMLNVSILRWLCINKNDEFRCLLSSPFADS